VLWGTTGGTTGMMFIRIKTYRDARGRGDAVDKWMMDVT